MTTPSGAIGLKDVNVELGRPGTQRIEMNDAAVRSLAQANASSGTTIAMDWLRNKSSYVPLQATGMGAVDQQDSQGSTAVLLSCSPSVRTSGGKGTIRYLWEKESGTATMSASNTGSSVRMTFSSKFGASSTGTVKCTVSDDVMTVVVTGIPYEMYAGQIA